MSRLIDADALLEQTQFRLPLDNYIAEIYDECVKIHRENIEQAPTIDAVPVVRCRDCKHFVSQWKNDDGTTSGFCIMFNIADRPSNCFCSSGKRKDGDE